MESNKTQPTAKNSFFTVELNTLSKLREALITLYRLKNFGLVPAEIRKVDLLLKKRIKKLSNIKKQQDKDKKDETTI